MNIQKQEKYFVGSHQFSSLEEAEKYAAQEQKQKDLITENTKRLDACDLTYIPVEIGEDLDIFYRGGEYHYPYESVFSSNGVRYCEEEIHVISQKQWLEKFVAEKMNHIIDVNDFSIVLRALVQFNLDNHVDSYNILEAISHFQFSPEYIYDR
jgi:hypothetical protein